MVKPKRFWFDLENAPDVLFFEPIARRLREMGHLVETTARDYSDVPELAGLYGIDGAVIGRYAGKRKIKKIIVGLWRSMRLAAWARGRGFDLAVGFGVRAQPIAAHLLGIRCATVFDYEHVSIEALNRYCDVIFIPEEVSPEGLVERGTPADKIQQYTGLKEEVYTQGYQPEAGLKERLALPEDKAIVLLRPPATSAHYHDHTSVTICERILERAAADASAHVIFLRRDGDATFDRFLEHENIRLLEEPVKGLDLISVCDVVISGGGTMVREAVALGVPAYSTFTGKQGAVDDALSAQGRLTLVRRSEEADKIVFEKCSERLDPSTQSPAVRDFFVEAFLRETGAE